MNGTFRAIVLVCGVLVWAVHGIAATVPIPVAKLERNEPVHFVKEILPILRANCLACHNQTKARADLVLESPQTILKGSENGPVVVPGQSEASLLLKVAAHEATPAMPPRDNKVAASDLTSEQLGLIQLWIDQGARSEVSRAETVAWQPLPEAYQPVYAVAINSDDQTAACSFANRIFLYHLPTGRLLTCLADPQLPALKSGAAGGFAHRDAIHALAFSPDGTILASGGYREVKLWRKHKKTPNFQLAASTNEVTATVLSRNARWLVTGDASGYIHVRELPGGALVQTLRGYPSLVRFLRFSPDGNHLLSASEDGVIRLWDFSTGGLSAQVRTAGDITAMTWLGDGEQFATASAEGSLQLWATSRDDPHAIVRGCEFHLRGGEVVCLESMLGCPEAMLSAGLDGVARLWDLRTGAVVQKLDHGAPIVALAVQPGRLASVGLDHTAVLWDVQSGKDLARLRGDHEAQQQVVQKARALHFATNELAYSHQAFDTAEKERKTQTDRVRKATESLSAAEKLAAEKLKKVDEARTATVAAEKPVTALKADLDQAKDSYTAIENTAEEARLNLAACIEALAQKKKNCVPEAPDTTDFAVAAELAARELQAKAHAAGEAKAQFERVTAEKRSSLKPAEEKLTAARKQLQEAEAEQKKAAQTQSNADNELTLAIAAAQKSAEGLSQTQNAIPLAEAEVKRAQADLTSAQVRAVEVEKPIYTVAFSPDGLLLATAGEDGVIRTWSAETGEGFESLGHGPAGLFALAFRSQHQIVCASADGGALGWEMDPDWRLEGVIGSGDDASPLVDRINALAFSPDGRKLAIGGGEPSRSGQIHFWDVATRRLGPEFNDVHSDTVFGLAFSRSGQFLASCAADRFMRVIDLGAGKVTRSFEGHTHHVLGVAWMDNGRTLATSGADNVVKIWDFRTGERRKNVDGFEKEVTAITSVAGEQFLVASGDHQVRLLNGNGETIQAYSGAKDFLYTAAASSDAKRIITGGQDGVVYLWDAIGRRELQLSPP